ncbi:hypothetical protein PQE99_gp03 [Streptococcus phage P4761]|uniref:Uncharacterized protein n=1 Tax=Streptococcus phage P4761 TaxID=1971417 RepID=A0A286QPI0_9CAUD|nr:hypothetical protein PQE99_gp03 [Streptococcus phage P4761]ARU13296.1 hypothetical protein P4761_03 [Streptococcus phage P4761]
MSDQQMKNWVKIGRLSFAKRNKHTDILLNLQNKLINYHYWQKCQ